MAAKRKICVFSGKRGGSGAYLPLMQLIRADPNLELSILLADMHTSEEFGQTAEEVQKFFPDVPIDLIEMGAGRSDTALARSENLSICLKEAGRILGRRRPDIVLVHADRGEHLMAALACQYLGIPVAHTQGGDLSGNIDDIQRHAITKLAHLHFPETERAAKLIRQFGEEEWRIHAVGSLYIDRIVKRMYTPPEIAGNKYGLGPNEPYGIIIFHPETEESREANFGFMREILKAAKELKMRFFVIHPCSDPGYGGVIHAIAEVLHDPSFLIYKNIENLDFLGLMAGARILIGNSSSALKEAPYFKLAAINVGQRQRGREREENVIDVEPTAAAILATVRYAWSDESFQAALSACGRHLGDGQASEKILGVLQSVQLDQKLLRKNTQAHFA